MNSKILFAVFAGLLIVFAAVKFFGKRSSPGTFPERLIEIDSSGVNRLLINPKAESGETIEFFLDQGSWRIKNETLEIPAAQGLAESMLAEIMNMKPKRLATKNSEKWSEFDATDSAATRVRVYSDQELLADVMIGRISYSQAPQQGYQMGGGNQVRGSSYVRLNDQDEVYSVEGFLAVTFNRNFNSYRNKTFLRLTKDSIQSLEFIYPLDSGFVLKRVDTNWAVGNQIVDNEKVDAYLGKIVSKNFNDFNDEFKADRGPEFRLIINEKGKGPTTVQGFDLGNGQYVLNSSFNSESMFEARLSDRNSMFPAVAGFFE